MNDRGLQFGDGLFETMLCVQGVPVDFEKHWQRLVHGCDRLDLPRPDMREQVLCAISEHGCPRAVTKLIVTRGSSERGYRCARTNTGNWILTIGDAPNIPESLYEVGVDVTVCCTRLPLEDPRLAGLKHLNRLTQVLARGEWEDEYFEGLLTDHADRIAEGTASNVFFVKDGILLTPDLSGGGVKGIVRQKVIEYAERSGMALQVRPVEQHELSEADEAFLTNSIYGVMPVRKIGSAAFGIGPVTKALARDLAHGSFLNRTLC